MTMCKLTLNTNSQKVQGKVKATNGTTFTLGGVIFYFPEGLTNKEIRKGQKCTVIFQGENGASNKVPANRIYIIDYPKGLCTVEHKNKTAHALIIDSKVISISIQDEENLNFIFPA